MSELAAAMLDWERTQLKADVLKASIILAVLDIGETQNVGNVRASYSKGRKSYDYRGAVDSAALTGLIELGGLEPYKTVVPETVNIDYRAACRGLGLGPSFTQSEPCVRVKLV